MQPTIHDRPEGFGESCGAVAADASRESRLDLTDVRQARHGNRRCGTSAIRPCFLEKAGAPVSTVATAHMKPLGWVIEPTRDIRLRLLIGFAHWIWRQLEWAIRPTDGAKAMKTRQDSESIRHFSDPQASGWMNRGIAHADNIHAPGTLCGASALRSKLRSTHAARAQQALVNHSIACSCIAGEISGSAMLPSTTVTALPPTQTDSSSTRSSSLPSRPSSRPWLTR